MGQSSLIHNSKTEEIAEIQIFSNFQIFSRAGKSPKMSECGRLLAVKCPISCIEEILQIGNYILFDLNPQIKLLRLISTLK
jgi:hypothetical protein